MRGVIEGLDHLRAEHKGSVVTIGNFDGVHLGHQKILDRVRQTAGRLGTRGMAITFDPHPIKAIAPERAPKLLTDTRKKALLLGRYGADRVLIINFTKDLASMSPEEFVREVLVNRLAVKAVIVGSGYSFGKARRGTTGFLRRQGKKYGFEVQVVRHAQAFKKVISSTRLRVVIGNGNMEKATRLLGRPYHMAGKVVTGAGRGGRILQTPTANFLTEAEVIPKDGVYVVRVNVGGMLLDGVANLGVNPTFKDAEHSMEVHVLDFDADLVGDNIEVQYIKRLRGEVKFPSPEKLREQIMLDIKEAREVLKKTPIEPRYLTVVQEG